MRRSLVWVVCDAMTRAPAALPERWNYAVEIKKFVTFDALQEIFGMGHGNQKTEATKLTITAY
jgi:hypothetical protein